MTKAHKTILVIEDEEMLRELLNELLSMEGYRVRLSENGHQGLMQLQTNPESIDLVILDFNLGDMSGKDLFEAIRKIKPSQQVIICSGDAYNQEIIALSQNNSVTIFNKPFDNTKLLTHIHSLFMAS